MRTRPIPLIFNLLAALALLAGCIQEDPQVEILRQRLEAAESEISTMRSESTQPAAAAPDTAEIRELQEKITQLERENADLRAKLSQSVVPLTQDELLLKLQAKSLPLREKIKTLYEVEQTSLRDVRIPDLGKAPYSCTVHLKLKNLATGAKEQVEIRATADARGEWSLPSLEVISANIQPDTPALTAAPVPLSPEPASPVRQTGPEAFPAPPQPPPVPTASPPPSPQNGGPQPPSRSQPTRPPMPAGPGEVVGEFVVPW